MAVFRQAFNRISKYSGVPLGFPNLGRLEPEVGLDYSERRARFYNQLLGCLRFPLPTICPLRGFPALLAKTGACSTRDLATLERSNKRKLHPVFTAMLGCAYGG